jgi:hypothetical protein
MSIKYIVYEDNQLWIDSVKKRKIDKEIVDAIQSFYTAKHKIKLPKTVYGYWITKEKVFIEDTETVQERNLNAK